MSFDAIFDEPDICAPDGPFKPPPEYRVTLTRAGETWIAEAQDLPGGLSVRVEGATYREADDAAFSQVYDVLGAGPGDIQVYVRPADAEATAVLDAIVDARINRAYAEQAERDAVRHAARLLTSQGWNTQDAAYALRMPVTRMPELLKTPDGSGD